MDFLNSLVSVFLVWALVTALFSANKARKRKLLLPPGPFPYPIVGNLFKLGDKPHKSLTDLAKTCGPIMSLRLGQVTTIVISSPTLAKEVMQTNDFSFSYRATPDSIRAQNHHLHSMVWLHPFNKWRSLRKISNSHIFANQRLDANQHLRQSKVEDLLLFVKECCGDGKPVNIGLAAFVTSLNLISNTVFSVDLVNPSYNSAQEFKELVWNIMVEAGKPNLADYFPVLRSIDPQGIRRRMSAHFAKMFEIFDHFIKQRMQSTEVADNDVLDVLLRIIHENKEINKEMMMHLFVDMFAAGTETTSSTVEWAMAEMLRNPIILLKVQKELNQVITKGKLVLESDIVNLPYLQAVVKETFRLHPPLPLLVPRRVEKDEELCGFLVPKNAQVLVNAWAIGRDPKIWIDPDSFLPDRFLGSNIDIRGHNFELIPFGAGRRICPGLPLAMRMIPLILGSLLHSFNWKLEDGVGLEEMDMSDKFGIAVQKAKPLVAIPVEL